MLYKTLVTYREYPTSVTVRVVYNADAGFPAVTFCNVNPIRKGKLEALIEWYLEEEGRDVLDILKEEVEMKGWEETDGQAASSTGSWNETTSYNMHAETSIVKKFYAELYDYAINITSYGHKLEHILLDCTYQGLQCSAADFVRWTHASYGNCYTYRQSSKTAVLSGASNGLSLTLFAQDDEYINEVISMIGFRVQIHDPEELPYPKESGTLISPGFMTSIGFRKLYIERQPLPYDGTDCIYSSEHEQYAQRNIFADIEEELGIETTYTHRTCEKTCYILSLIDRCNCTDPTVISRKAMLTSHERMSTFFGFGDWNETELPPACDLGRKEIYSCQIRVLKERTQCTEMCPQACQDNIYVVNVASAVWPSEKYLINSLSNWWARSPDAFGNTLKKELPEDFETGSRKKRESGSGFPGSQPASGSSPPASNDTASQSGPRGSPLASNDTASQSGPGGSPIGSNDTGFQPGPGGPLPASNDTESRPGPGGSPLSSNDTGSESGPEGTLQASNDTGTGLEPEPGLSVSLPPEQNSPTPAPAPSAPTKVEMIDEIIQTLGNRLTTTLRENIARVDVFFEELNYQSIIESPSYTHIDLLVNVGGTFGLWVGMCMLTFLEIFEFSFDLCCIWIRGKELDEDEIEGTSNIHK